MKIVQPYKKHPDGLYGNKITCPSHLCKKEFIVTHAILKDRDTPEGILEAETHKGFQPRQAILQEFLEWRRLDLFILSATSTRTAISAVEIHAQQNRWN